MNPISLTDKLKDAWTEGARDGCWVRILQYEGNNAKEALKKSEEESRNLRDAAIDKEILECGLYLWGFQYGFYIKSSNE